jgi:hypothetical protein
MALSAGLATAAAGGVRGVPAALQGQPGVVPARLPGAEAAGAAGAPGGGGASGRHHGALLHGRHVIGRHQPRDSRDHRHRHEPHWRYCSTLIPLHFCSFFAQPSWLRCLGSHVGCQYLYYYAEERFVGKIEVHDCVGIQARATVERAERTRSGGRSWRMLGPTANPPRSRT